MSKNAEIHEDTDDSSIKPVSSLRSHFENMIKSKPSPAQPAPNSLPSKNSLTVNQNSIESGSRGASLDIPRCSPLQPSSPGQILFSVAESNDGEAVPSHLATPELRPVSMGPLSPYLSPPVVTIDSPQSPPKFPESPHSRGVSMQTSREDFRRTIGSRAGSPTNGTLRSLKTPSRSTTTPIDTRQTPYFPAVPSPTITMDPDKLDTPGRAWSSASSVPPPINRAGKPRTFSKPSPITGRQVSETLEPNGHDAREEDRISPFNTPPGEHETVHCEDVNPSPPPIPEFSKPQAPPPRPAREGYFAPPPFRYADGELKPAPSKPESRETWMDSMKLPSRPVLQRYEVPTNRPYLPPRRENGSSKPSEKSPRPPPLGPPPPGPPPRRSMDTSSVIATSRPSLSTPIRTSMENVDSPRTLIGDVNNKFQPPPRRAQTSVIHSQNGKPSEESWKAQTLARGGKVLDSAEGSEDEVVDYSIALGTTLSDYPDSSLANRRPPRFKERPHDIATKYETKLFAICGEYVCTSGFITRAWSLLTGETIMNIPHGETVKVTAMAFKPAKSTDDDGKRIWLGTSQGELHEIDIPTQTVVVKKSNAHTRLITKIHRRASEMWTLDEDGLLLIWMVGDDGLPSLALSPHICHVPGGATFSMIVGDQLWLAFGKEIFIFQPSAATRTATQVSQQPLAQSGVGKVTAGAIISSQADRIYFGHIDGKVTIYSRKDLTCLGIVNVSLYKISSLVGVGDYLWAGFNTGMIYVYDTGCKPWKVKKDWKAHEKTMAGILVDGTSVWKMDRLQVASLGTDGFIRIWDGMLKDDWLETDMQEHDAEFCDFREVSALVMTWNAGASKPAHLKHDNQDSNFFRELLRSPVDAPDIVVFGFQELVDLEDKKVTARTLFKSSKKKEHNDHERMSHQYRAWRDHLAKCLDEYMPAKQPYTLLHTANLVGLFTCVFVKTSEVPRIRNVDAAEIKLGMKGRYGNKGALVVRFLLDDSSVCFVNCHLAAGQRNTTHRNNDIAAIMESSALKSSHDGSNRSDSFVSGGDGSHILDHEICILNGDLNYRIDSMSRDIVIRDVKAGNLAKLLERDQLLLSMKKNPGFRLRAFQEREITFAPTYKYDVGSDQYDSSEKRRSPAWCDRLLYRGVGRIKQLDYRRHEVRVSDHRPVSGLFKLRVKTINSKRRTAVNQKCEERFGKVKQRIEMIIKVHHLVNVLGLTQAEAEQHLMR